MRIVHTHKAQTLHMHISSRNHTESHTLIVMNSCYTNPYNTVLHLRTQCTPYMEGSELGTFLIRKAPSSEVYPVPNRVVKHYN